MAAAREGRAADATCRIRFRRPAGWPAAMALICVLKVDGPTATVWPQVRCGTDSLRIVSLLPAVTATLDALGVSGCIVGRASDDRTPSTRSVRVVGTVLRPDPEQVLAVSPTVVFAGAASMPTALSSVLGARIVTIVRFDRLDDVVPGIRAVAVRVGRAEAGRRLAEDVEDRLARVAAGTEARRAAGNDVEVLWAVGFDPPIVSGPGGLPDDLIELVGGRNVFDDALAPWFRPSAEQLRTRGALTDVLVWPLGGDLPRPSDVPADSPWRLILNAPGVRVVEVDADLVHEAGPHLPLAAQLLALRLNDSTAPADAPLPSATEK